MLVASAFFLFISSVVCASYKNDNDNNLGNSFQSLLWFVRKNEHTFQTDSINEELDSLLYVTLPIVRKYENEINRGIRTEIDRDSTTSGISVAFTNHGEKPMAKTFTDTDVDNINGGIAVALASAKASADASGSAAKTLTYNLANGTGTVADVCNMYAQANPIMIETRYCAAKLNNEAHRYYGACESGKAVFSKPHIKDVYAQESHQFKLVVYVETNDVIVDIRRPLKHEGVPLDCLPNVDSYVTGTVVVKTRLQHQLPSKFEYLLFSDSDSSDKDSHDACLTYAKWDKEIKADLLKCYVKDFEWYIKGKNICDSGKAKKCPLGDKDDCINACHLAETKYCKVANKELNKLLQVSHLSDCYNDNVNKILPVCPYNIKSLPDSF